MLCMNLLSKLYLYDDVDDFSARLPFIFCSITIFNSFLVFKANLSAQIDDDERKNSTIAVYFFTIGLNKKTAVTDLNKNNFQQKKYRYENAISQVCLSH